MIFLVSVINIQNNMTNQIILNNTDLIANEIVPERTILLGYVGSISHGTYIPSAIDDIDLMGVAIANEDVYFGMKNFEQKEYKKDQWDTVTYEIRKYFRLLLKQNPNVLALLWLRKEDYIFVSDIGQLILDNKNLFVSKEAYYSFSGYAYGQLKRMEHHVFQGYMGEKRKKLVEKFGYDCKNASHLIRLLRMGIEFLNTGVLQVFRKDDADELKRIKTGEWTLEQVKEKSNELFDQAKESFEKSTLPKYPDVKNAEKLLISILKKELL